MSIGGQSWGYGESERRRPQKRPSWFERQISKLVLALADRWRSFRDRK